MIWYDILRGYTIGSLVWMFTSCTGRADVSSPHPNAPGYYEAHGCARSPDNDFACESREIFTSAYVDCTIDPDLCHFNSYGSWCCFPDPGAP